MAAIHSTVGGLDPSGNRKEIAVDSSGNLRIAEVGETITPTATPAIGTSAGTVLSANASRVRWYIQNLGTNPLFVRYGASASTTVFHFVLNADSASDAGNGGKWTDNEWNGIVSVAGTSPRYVVWES